MDIRLGFEAISCLRCGERRQLGLDCPDCGARAAPTEVDLEYQSRLRALGPVKQSRALPGAAMADSPWRMLASPLIAGLTKRISNGANAISRTRRAQADELQQIATDIANLEAWVSETPELRPSAAYARHVKTAVEHLIGVFDVTVSMLEARNGSDAQQLEPTLQRHLDAATEAISRCDELTDQITELSQSDNPVATWMRLATGGDVLLAEPRGTTLLEERGLREDQHKAGVGMLALLWDFIARTTSDERSFWSYAAEHRTLLAAHRDRVTEIAETDAFRQRAADTLDDLLHAARLAIAQGDTESQRQKASDLLDFGHRLVEQPLKLHLGVACAASTRQHFESTQASDVSSLIQVARQRGWPVASLLGNSDIRNAFAHRDYSVRSDGMIELCSALCRAQGRPAPVVSLDELCDAVLAISEACGVMDMALGLVTGRGVGDHTDGTSPFLIRSVAEGLLAWDDVDLRLEDDEAVIEARYTRPVNFAEVQSLASTLLGDRSRLIVRLATNDRHHEIRIPISEFKERSQVESDTARSTALLLAWHRATVDGAPAFTGAQVRKALAVQVLQLLADKTKQFAEIRHDLASLRQAAKAVDDHELAKTIAACIGWKAQIASGHRSASSPIDRLVAIAAVETQPITEWIVLD